MPRASPSTPKKSRTESPASPSKVKIKFPPGINTRRKEWRQSLPTPWTLNANFRHPTGTWTILKAAAAKKYPILNDEDFKTLPYEQRMADTGNWAHLYSEGRVEDLALRKNNKLEVDLIIVEEGVEHRRERPRPQPWEIQPPLKIIDYTCPSEATVPDPEGIIWTPSKIDGPVTVADACRLYCIEPNDIQDLSACSPWIDLETVAKRAVTLHGGFHAHKDLLFRHRNAEEAALQAIVDRTHMGDDGISEFKFSTTTLKQMEEIQKLEEDAWMYEIPGSTSSRTKNQVAVFYPIKKVAMDGWMWEWCPFWEDF
ncbi:hypothetical protein R3P38DRAFT_3359280 [Favolaschia claudopus]|uniref:Uncharacterized protein n=1 Tax=Favolaschia claudopus TaxID=2862362 RepID=A0AAW0B0S9_9AGAR